MDQIKKNTVSAKNQVNWNVQVEKEDGRGIRILFVGNSITRHEVLEDIGWLNDWGMAASAKEKDYVHQVEARVLEKDQDAVFCICQAADWEYDYKNGEKMYPNDKTANIQLHFQEKYAIMIKSILFLI